MEMDNLLNSVHVACTREINRVQSIKGFEQKWAQKKIKQKIVCVLIIMCLDQWLPFLTQSAQRVSVR